MTFVFVFGPKMEFHFRLHFPLRQKMKSAFSIGLCIKLFQITPYVNDFQTLNNPIRTVCALKISYPPFLTQVLHPSSSSSSSSSLRWSVPPGDLRSPQHSSRTLVSSWTLLRQMLRGRPGGLLQLTLSFCLCMYPPSDAEHHMLQVLQGPGVQHGQTDKRWWRIRCHQWLINQIAEAPLHWRHEPVHKHISSICRWHLMWKASVFMSATKRAYAEQTLSWYGCTLVLILRLLQFPL